MEVNESVLLYPSYWHRPPASPLKTAESSFAPSLQMGAIAERGQSQILATEAFAHRISPSDDEIGCHWDLLDNALRAQAGDSHAHRRSNRLCKEKIRKAASRHQEMICFRDT